MTATTTACQTLWDACPDNANECCDADGDGHGRPQQTLMTTMTASRTPCDSITRATRDNDGAPDMLPTPLLSDNPREFRLILGQETAWATACRSLTSDNDGVPDLLDMFPYDRDNDGVPDALDAFPAERHVLRGLNPVDLGYYFDFSLNHWGMRQIATWRSSRWLHTGVTRWYTESSGTDGSRRNHCVWSCGEAHRSGQRPPTWRSRAQCTTAMHQDS